MDYNPRSAESVAFFKMVQNKLHYAAHGHTAAEVIYERADADKPFMGLTTFSGDFPTAKDIGIAKNYLTEEELRVLNQMVSGYFDFAEVQAIRHRPMYMSDYVEQLDNILRATGEEVLTHAGKISHAQAMEKAKAEYKRYKAQNAFPCGGGISEDHQDSWEKRPRRKRKSRMILLIQVKIANPIFDWHHMRKIKMQKEKIKVYTYTRVSTAMQVDGYSLDAQKAKMKAYADYNDYEIVGEYEDAGKSGKSIEGRAQFSQMMEDIKSGKDGVSYVLVFKLSRFGRNAADVLSSLQVMQDFGVNLVCVEDGIDSSKDAGKLMISVLSAVAEIERENIRVQTMEGRIQKAREGRWNGGFAPYGYQLVDGKLIINEEEAEAIRVIYDQYVHTDIGANGIAKYLENHGIRKIPRQNGKNPLFDAHLIRLILKNPVYCGKIAYGRRKTEKVRGTRNEYKLVEQDNYLLADGQHEAIVSEEVWQAAQVKLLAQAKKYEHVNRGKDEHVHLLSGIVKCPVCGAGMYGNKSIKHKADGTKYKDFYYYGCKHRSMIRGHKCDYKKQIREELLDDAVAEVIVKLVSNPKFAAMMQEKINMKVDTAAIDQEIANYEKQLRQHYSVKAKLAEEIDSLDPDDRHYVRRKADLDDRLYKMYDKIEDTESLLIAARAKKQAIEAEKLTGDNIYKVLIYFEKLYGVMNEVERRQLIEALISEIQIYPERQPNGQWLKSIKFKLPIIEEDMSISLDNEEQVETVCLLSKLHASCHSET